MYETPSPIIQPNLSPTTLRQFARSIDSFEQKKQILVSPLNLLNSLFGLNPLFRPRLAYLVYSVVCVVVYLVIAVFAYPHVFAKHAVEMRNPVPEKISYVTNFFFIVSFVVMAWRWSEDTTILAKQAITADDFMKAIGIDTSDKPLLDYIWKKFRNVVLLIVTAIIVAIVGFFFKNTENAMTITLLKLIALYYPPIVISVTNLTFVRCVRCACYKFNQLNEQLKNLLTCTSDSPQHKRLATRSRTLSDSTIGSRNYSEAVRVAEKVHLALTKICTITGKIYGLQMLMSVIASLMSVTGNIFVFYSLRRRIYQSDEKEDILGDVIRLTTCIVYHASNIWNLCWACDDCKNEATRTGDLINELYDEPRVDAETQTEMRNFNVQLIENELKFTAYGFVPLDYTLIRVTIGTITTYLLILFELNGIMQDDKQ